MHLEHFEKGIRYSAKELETIARKVGKLATICRKLKDEASVVRVEAEKRETKKQSDEVKVMMTVELPQKVLRSESRKATVMEAFDRAVEKLEPQLVRYKERNTDRKLVSRQRRS